MTSTQQRPTSPDCLAEGTVDEEPEPEGQESTTESHNETEEEEEGVFTGRIDLVGPSHGDPSTIILHRKSQAVVMLKQGGNLALAEADTGSDFTLIWDGFAKQSKINFVRNNTICQRFQLVDISGLWLCRFGGQHSWRNS